MLDKNQTVIARFDEVLSIKAAKHAVLELKSSSEAKFQEIQLVMSNNDAKINSFLQI